MAQYRENPTTGINQNEIVSKVVDCFVSWAEEQGYSVSLDSQKLSTPPKDPTGTMFIFDIWEGYSCNGYSRSNHHGYLNIFFDRTGQRAYVHDFSLPKEERQQVRLEELPEYQTEFSLSEKQALVQMKMDSRNMPLADVQRMERERKEEVKAANEEHAEVAQILYSHTYSLSADYEGRDTAASYLKRKGILSFVDFAFSGIRWALDCDSGKYALFVPIVSVKTQKIINIQKIFPDGEKRYISNTNGAKPLIDGGVFIVRKFKGNRPVICLCEGIATAYSVAQLVDDDVGVVACFDAGNMKRTAHTLLNLKALQEHNAVLVVCADNDHLEKSSGKQRKLDENTGLMAALSIVKEARNIKNNRITVIGTAPEFKPKENGSDWNDYALLYGWDTAKREFEEAVKAQIGASPVVRF